MFKRGILTMILVLGFSAAALAGGGRHGQNWGGHGHEGGQQFSICWSIQDGHGNHPAFSGFFCDSTKPQHNWKPGPWNHHGPWKHHGPWNDHHNNRPPRYPAPWGHER